MGWDLRHELAYGRGGKCSSRPWPTEQGRAMVFEVEEAEHIQV